MKVAHFSEKLVNIRLPCGTFQKIVIFNAFAIGTSDPKLRTYVNISAFQVAENNYAAAS
jgi:hypothetical protein